MDRVFGALASLAAFVCGPALADAGLTAADVVPEALRTEIAICMSTAPHPAAGLDCLARDGVSEPARRFAAETADGSALGAVAVLTGVDALGDITIASSLFPALSGPEMQTVLLARAPRAVPLVELVFTPDPPRAGETRAIRSRHPAATEASQPRITAYRVLPDGGQRLIVTDTVRDGCATCAEVGTAVVYLDFLRGVLVSTQRMGWFDAETDPAAAAARLEAADIGVLQRRLILSGYDAGPVDGVVGPRTRAAFYALKTDLCLPEDRRIRPVIPALAPDAITLTPAACAPDPDLRPES